MKIIVFKREYIRLELNTRLVYCLCTILDVKLDDMVLCFNSPVCCRSDILMRTVFHVITPQHIDPLN